VAVKNKVEVFLSRLGPLEALFATPPGNVVEQRRRTGLIRCATSGHLYIPIPNFLPASSRASRNNCGYCRDCSGLLARLKQVKMCSAFSTTYKRQSFTIRFVHDLMFFSTSTSATDGATNVDRRSRIQTDSEYPPSLRSDKRNDLSPGPRSGHPRFPCTK
jgi:hypothetical protein